MRHLHSKIYTRGQKISCLCSFLLLLFLVVSACTPRNGNIASTRTTTPISNSAGNDLQAGDKVPASPTPGPSSTPTVPTTTIDQSAITSSPTPTQQTEQRSQTATPCPDNSCTYSHPFMFSKPISPDNNDSVDTSYRFGSTQGGKRDPHHGIEFLNSAGTPVLAAGDGVVLVAGDDLETLYSPYPNFYGNLIVLEHPVPAEIAEVIPDSPEFIYTLYAHLSEILVEEGDSVQTGQEIGLVGMSGSATGSHLHFEVRYGENQYEQARNPELWMVPELNENNHEGGAIAGKIIASDGSFPDVNNIVLQYYPDGPEQPSTSEYYIQTYKGSDQAGQLPWNESFGIGSLPAGIYRISYPLYGLQRHFVEVFPGSITIITFDAGY